MNNCWFNIIKFKLGSKTQRSNGYMTCQHLVYNKTFNSFRSEWGVLYQFHQFVSFFWAPKSDCDLRSRSLNFVPNNSSLYKEKFCQVASKFVHGIWTYRSHITVHILCHPTNQAHPSTLASSTSTCLLIPACEYWRHKCSCESPEEEWCSPRFRDKYNAASFFGVCLLILQTYFEHFNLPML